MMIKYGADINIHLAKEALKRRLYVKGWTLQHKLSSIVNGYESFPIALYYHLNSPIGVIMVNTEYNVFEIFVHQSHRRLGIGTCLLKYMKSKFPNVKGNSNGTAGSLSFFISNNLETINIYNMETLC